jgi:hypothetical protein
MQINGKEAESILLNNKHMKKALFFSALLALILTGCKSDEPQAKHQVTFRVPSLMVETEPMPAPLKVAPLTDDDGQQMTDLILFDGATYIMRQQSTDPNFGTVTVLLTAGEHNLHFISTRSTELSYDEGILNCASLRPTYGKHYDINVTGGSDEYVTMDRITGQVVITIEDEIPAGAANLRIQFGDYYKGLNPTTFAGVRSGSFDQTVSISSKVGMTDQQWRLNILVPAYGETSETSYTLTATNGSGEIIGQATGTMTICSNTKTLLHGNLFTGTRSFVSLSTAWNSDIDEGF